MAVEKSWSKVGPLVLLADGDKEGTVLVPSTRGLYVKQQIILQSSAQTFTNLEIKAVLSKNILKVGPRSPGMSEFTDIRSLLVSDGASLRAERQSRPSIPEKEYSRAEFAEEPIVAKRTISVDSTGEYYGEDNPTPVKLVDGSMTSVLFSEINSVPFNVEAQIFSYTALSTDETSLLKIDVSGDNIATFTIKLNGNVINKKRTYFGGSLNECFDFKELKLVPNDILTVDVIHHRPNPGSFSVSTFLSRKPI